jgi:hypothetical protein
VRGVPAWALKVGAVVLTMLAAIGSASYVGGHVKNQSAPLRPAVQPAATQGEVAPGVHVTASQPLTETHES